ALVAGLRRARRGDADADGPGDDVVLVERLPARRRELEQRFADGGVTVTAELPPSVASAVVAVKPHDVEAACRGLAAAGARRVLSIAAGVTLSSLRGWLGDGPAVLRAMPNTPALVSAGASAVAPGPGAGEGDVAWAQGILEAVGSVEVVEERHLDAVTGLSGSGPAYLFLVAEALIDGGVLNGLPRAVAARLVTRTVLGAGRLLTESGESPEALRAAVTSPGGTTAAGLRALEARAVRAALLEAVTASAERAAELGREGPPA
ncbi:pyrroline-5-carboxylate reductase, partial [Acidimicrobiaceae bacterium USS-CC1]|nr:pyrroline-5-carboxylate reductase [Acidiferrimicrobium australe]